MKIISTLVAVTLALLSTTTTSTDAVFCGPRVRKSWESLTTEEKDLYKRAVASAMDNGEYIKFVEIHTEMMSEMEAHGNCMFLYWHRQMLVVYENMLRGQGSEFACVTLPYWDWVTGHARFTSRKCRSMAKCSDILSELGATDGTFKKVKINGETTEGICVEAFPLNHFCQKSSVRGKACLNCVPRGPWDQSSFPATASYASVQNQLFQGRNIADVSSSLELGVHNNIHSSLDGAMASFISPSDPIFYSHHATIDLLHSIFHKCRVGEGFMTPDEKAQNKVGWQNCLRRNGKAYGAYDHITMRTGEGGVNTINARKDPLISKYFKGVPRSFSAMMNIHDLGDSAYSYEVSGPFADFYTKCGKTRPSSTDGDIFFISTTRKLRDAGEDKAAIKVVDKEVDASVKDVLNWASNTTTNIMSKGKFDEKQANNELEKMMCVFQDECLGGVKDFSETFKKNFGVTEPPRCLKIVNDIKSGADTIAEENWRDSMIKTYGCPSKNIAKA